MPHIIDAILIWPPSQLIVHILHIHILIGNARLFTNESSHELGREHIKGSFFFKTMENPLLSTMPPSLMFLIKEMYFKMTKVISIWEFLLLSWWFKVLYIYIYIELYTLNYIIELNIIVYYKILIFECI